MLNNFIKKINESKVFAGIIIILLNVGGKLIPITLSKSAEHIIKSKVSRDIIVFAISWMGTRDVLTAIFLTIFFIVLSDYLLNHDSRYCVIPHKHRIIPIKDTDEVTDEELNAAINILEKSKKNKEMKEQHYAYSRFFN
jgi:hypothetical protein